MYQNRFRSLPQFLGVPISTWVLALLLCATLNANEPTESGRKRGLLHALAFSADGSRLAVGGESICIYDVKSGALLTRWSPPPMTRTIAFLPTAPDVVVEAGDGGTIRFRKVGEDHPFRELKIHNGRVQHIVLSPDGTVAASTATILIKLRPPRAELRVWKIDSGEIIGSIDVEIGALYRPAFAPDGKALLVPQIKRLPGEDEEAAGSVELYRIPDWKHLQIIATPGYALSAVFCPNGQDLMLAGVADREQGIRGPGKIWRAHRSNNKVSELDSNGTSVFNHVLYAGPEQRFLFGTTTETEFGRDGKTILPRQARVVMRSNLTGREIWTSTSEDDRDEVQAITVSPNGEKVAWCTFGTILILDADAGRLLLGIGVTE